MAHTMHATQKQLQDPALELRPVPEVPNWSLVAQDRTLSQHIFQTVGQHIPRSLLMALEHSGNGLIWLTLSLGALLHPALSDDQRCLAVNFLLAFFVDLAIVGTLKGLVRRPRPIYNKSGDFLLVVSVDRFSFPSGHTSRAAYVAAFVCICCAGTSPPLCWMVSFWAAIVAVSRAALGRHYAGDVLAGLLVGIINMGFTTRGTYSPAGFWVDAEQLEHLTKLATTQGRQWLQQ